MIYKLTLARRACRVKEAKSYYDVSIKKPADLFDLAQRLLKGEAQEVFLCFHLNIRCCVIGYTEVARGCFESCQVDPKVVFSSVLLAGACNIILAHNHPSGDPNHSRDDIDLVRRLKRGAELLGITLVDHLVIANDTYTSLAEDSILSKL